MKNFSTTYLAEFNPFHAPGGSPEGGRFTYAPETGAGAAAIKRYIDPKRHESLDRALTHLHDGIAAKAIPNADYNAAKDTINRYVDHAVDGWQKENNWYGQGYTGIDTSVMGAYNLPAAYKEAVKKSTNSDKIKAYADFLATLLPIADALKEAKPFIFKRQPKAVKTAPVDSTEGSCQICARIIKNKKGVIAHHGYERPGLGWQTDSCMGARYPSYEVSRDRIPAAIDNLKSFLDNMKSTLKKLRNNPPETLQVRKRGYHRFGGGREPDTTITLNRPIDFDPKDEVWRYRSDDYVSELKNMIHQVESQIKSGEPTLTFLRKRYDDWKPAAT